MVDTEQYTLNSFDQKITRREFCKDVLLAGIAFAAIWANAYKLVDDKLDIARPTKERFLSKSDGYRLGILAGNHGVPGQSSGRDTTISKSDLFLPIGAIFLDSPANLDPGIQEEHILAAIEQVSQTRPNFYKEPFDYVLQEGVPLVVGDIDLKGMPVDAFVNEYGDNLITKSTTAAVASAITSLGRLALELNPKLYTVNRRDFLRWMASGAAIAGAYYATPAFTHVASDLGLHPESPAGRDLQAIFKDLIHPANTLINMRNIVWSLKSRDLYQTEVIPKEKIINILGGFDHRFTDFFFRHPEIAKQYWKTFHYADIAREISLGDPSWVHKSHIYRPDQHTVTIHEHKSLEDLVAA